LVTVFCVAGIKPFVCLICNTTFTRQHSLNYHMLIHKNLNRFTCKECGRMFRHPSHYKVCLLSTTVVMYVPIWGLPTPGLILRIILDCTGWDIYGERGARTYNGGLGAEPQRGPGAEPRRQSWGEAPLKLTAF